jgi:dTMP kinase
MALFVTFEGGEGCGKSVQARALYRRLSQLTIPVLLIHEPGGTPLGNKIGYWLKWGHDTKIAPLTELLLFNASRAQLVEEVIQPSLKAGKVVIGDRFFDSTIAYQSYGRGLDLAMVKSICRAATKGLKPDLTVLLDIPAEEGLARKSARRHDRFEEAGLAFHRRVRSGYLKMAKEEPQRWVVIDARQPRKKIAEIIWQRVSQRLKTR